MTTPAASLVDARRWNFTGEPTQVHRKSGRACSGRWDLGIMPPREHAAERAPLRRNVDPREVGNTALFLCSPMSSAITGEVIYVDCGYNIMGI